MKREGASKQEAAGIFLGVWEGWDCWSFSDCFYSGSSCLLIYSVMDEDSAYGSVPETPWQLRVLPPPTESSPAQSKTAKELVELPTH